MSRRLLFTASLQTDVLLEAAWRADALDARLEAAFAWSFRMLTRDDRPVSPDQVSCVVDRLFEQSLQAILGSADKSSSRSEAETAALVATLDAALDRAARARDYSRAKAPLSKALASLGLSAPVDAQTAAALHIEAFSQV